MGRIIIMLLACAILAGCAATRAGSAKKNDVHARHEFPYQREATGRKTFVFSPRTMAWAAYDEMGQRIRIGPASGGVDVCPERGGNCRTIVGQFRVLRKGDHTCVSKKFPLGKGGAPMPYCMFFYRGFAIHGSPVVPNVPSSHGCIRVTTSDAQWLSTAFLDIGARVIVESY